MNIEEIFSHYNIEYKLSKESLEIWRNGYHSKINLPINISNLPIYLDIFGVYSPHSTKELKEMFPFYFEAPEFGEYICVKRLGGHPDLYQFKQFKEFRNGKIVCFEEDKEEYDFYQIGA